MKLSVLHCLSVVKKTEQVRLFDIIEHGIIRCAYSDLSIPNGHGNGNKSNLCTLDWGAGHYKGGIRAWLSMVE